MSELRLVNVTILTTLCLCAGSSPVLAEPNVPIPQAARDRYDQGQALEKQGKLKEAIEAYQDAINLGMQLYPRAHLKEAKAFLALKEYGAALARFTRFIDGFGLEDSCRY
jgi:tetratricopeptide (TPR) repeat protein